MRQILHLLYYPQSAGPLSQCAYGAAFERGRVLSRAGSSGADFGGPGDDSLRGGSVWEKDAAGAFAPAGSHFRHLLDTDPVLLSGGDYGRAD